MSKPATHDRFARYLRWVVPLPLVVALGLVAPAALPAGAVTAGAFDIAFTPIGSPTLGTDYTYAGNVLTVMGSGDYTITMAASGVTTTDRIVVTGNCQITLNEVFIDQAGSGSQAPNNTVPHTAGVAALEVANGAAVNLTLRNDNYLQSGVAQAGVQVQAGGSLTVTGEGFGSLFADGGPGGAGLGGGGAVTIAGGSIYAQGGSGNFTGGASSRTGSGAGIGGNYAQDGGTITITGGDVRATGGANAAGIGGGGASSGSGGGGGTITIIGGTVEAVGWGGGAGIGGGYGQNMNITSACGTGGSGAAGTIAIGGTANVTARSFAAGIGSGRGKGPAGTITIDEDAVVNAHGGVGAGIGGGYGGDGGTISIGDNAKVTAQGNDGAGIGGGSCGSADYGPAVAGNGGTITIGGNAEVEATGSAAGIGGGLSGAGGTGGDGGTISIGDNAKVTAQGSGGAGIGGGSGTNSGAGGAITINGNATVVATNLNAPDLGGSAGVGGGGGRQDTTFGQELPGTGGASGTIVIGGSASVTASGGSYTPGSGTPVPTGGGAGIGSGGGATGTATPPTTGTDPGLPGEVNAIDIATSGTVAATGGSGDGTPRGNGAPLGAGGVEGVVGTGFDITAHPAMGTVNEPDSATFDVAVKPTGQAAVDGATAEPTYQWQTPGGGGLWEAVADGTGGTTDSYTTAATTAAMSGQQFRCVVQSSDVNGDGSGTIIYTSHAASLTVLAPPTPISLFSLDGVTAPMAGGTPVALITSTDEYFGTVSWAPADNPFGYNTSYTATIELTPKAGYTLSSVPADAFSVAGATSVTNLAGSGVILATFPTTAEAPISLFDIDGVALPAAGATPVTAITETAEYTGTVSWDPADSPFGYYTEYSATITLTPKAGYTLLGVPADAFAVAGATSVTNSANSGVIEAVFPTTGPDPVTTFVIDGLSAPVAGGTPVSAITETAEFSGNVTWDPAHDPFGYDTVYTATIALTPKAGYRLSNLLTYYGFSVAGATSVTNLAGSGVIEVVFPATAPEPTYQLTLLAGAGGSITTGSSGSYTAGTVIPVEALADPGYVFDGWTSSAGGTLADSAAATTTFAMPANATTVTANFKTATIGPPAPLLVQYTVITDFGLWAGSGTISGTVDGPAGDFVRLELGGQTVDPSNYQVTAGSTIIELTEAYLKTLANGVYQFKAIFDAGYADLALTVAVAAGPPPPGAPPGSGSVYGVLPVTGANTHTLCLLALVLCSLGGVLIGRSRMRSI